MTITNPERPKTLLTNWFYGFLIIIIVLGVLLRCIHIDNRVYWGDEIVTSLRMSGSSYAEGIQNLTNKSILSISDLMTYQQPSSSRDLADTVKGLINEEPQHAPVYFILVRLCQGYFILENGIRVGKVSPIQI